MYSQDGWGLGHLRRSFNIAQELVGSSPPCDVLIVADSPALSIMGLHPRIEVLKLPTIIKTGEHSWRNAALSGSTRPVLRLRQRLILEAAVEFRPDVILVDHMPVGAMGELKPMLDAATTGRRRPRLLLGLRDIIDAPPVVRRVWRGLGAYDYLPAYESVMVYGTRSIFDPSSAYGFAGVARDVAFCDYVSTRPSPTAIATKRRPYVLMLGGGGGDAFPLAWAFVEALQALSHERGLEAVVMTGPNMSADERRTLSRRLPRGLRLAAPFDDAAPWIRGASAVVSMAGYNSVCELLRWQKKALVVPRRGPSAEQRMRSDLFAERSLLRLLNPDELSGAALAAELASLLEDSRVPDVESIPSLEGASRSARMVLSADDAEEEAAPASATPLLEAPIGRTASGGAP